MPPLGTSTSGLPSATSTAAECLLVGPGIKTGMAIRIDNPYEVGADRLVNAVAAYERFGEACVVVDFGTGINFDAVSADGEYLGGAIAPGVEISLTALTERGARIPADRPGRAGNRDREVHTDRDPVRGRLTASPG